MSASDGLAYGLFTLGIFHLLQVLCEQPIIPHNHFSYVDWSFRTSSLPTLALKVFFSIAPLSNSYYQSLFSPRLSTSSDPNLHITRAVQLSIRL